MATLVFEKGVSPGVATGNAITDPTMRLYANNLETIRIYQDNNARSHYPSGLRPGLSTLFALQHFVDKRLTIVDFPSLGAY